MAPDSGRIGTGVMIRRARERKRMRQKDLAHALGVSRNTVDAWENGRAYPRSSIGALEELLGISLSAEDGGDASQPAPITPEDEWERLVLADQTLPMDERRDIVMRARRLRAQLYRPGQAPAVADPPRSAAG